MCTISGMKICPRCKGSTTIKGKDCEVCKGSGVLTHNGEYVSYEDGTRFYDWWQEQIHNETHSKKESLTR